MLETLICRIHWVLLSYNEQDEVGIKFYPFIFIKYYFLLNNGLTNLYTIRDIKHISDIPHGIIVINGIIISILLSLLVQLLFIDKVSL